MTDQKRDAESAEPTPELSESATDLEPQATPLAHDEPDAAHGHGHGEPRLGPIDWSAWGYAVVGAVIALVMVGAFWVAAYRP